MSYFAKKFLLNYDLSIWVEVSESDCLQRVIKRSVNFRSEKEVINDRANWTPILDRYILENEPMENANIVVLN
jgi:pantothenate kinase